MPPEYVAMKSGGFIPLLQEEVAVGAAASNPFANAPVGAQGITVTVRGADTTWTFDGTTPTVANHGIDIPQNTPYELALSRPLLTAIKAVSGGAAKIAVVYWGI